MEKAKGVALATILGLLGGEGGAMNILSMRSVRRCSRKDSTWNFSHYIVHCKSKYNGLIHRYIVAL
jgi:hypothetical protein